MLSKSHKKRSRVTREQVLQRFALDGDVACGREHHLHESATYILESMGGSMAAWCMTARKCTDSTKIVMGSWMYNGDPTADEGTEDRKSGHSILLFNKLYGHSIVVPVRKSDVREEMHMFSAYLPANEFRDPSMQKSGSDWPYEPLYGGYTDRGEHANPRYVPRPAVMDRVTQNFIIEATFDFGWRALMYENRGESDPWPTGIVALEGFLFRRTTRMNTSKSGKHYEEHGAQDETDIAVYAARVQTLLNRVPIIAREHAERVAQRQQPPRVVDTTVHPDVAQQFAMNARADEKSYMELD